MSAPVITLIGGPTALIEANGFRLLTDPTFDVPGEYKLPHVTLKKLTGPARTADQVGQVDAVLLSHDQHADNFDRSGKAFAMAAPRLFTTLAGAQRLGTPAEGLAPWQSAKISKQDGATLQITATPARHGPAGIEPLSGDVIGFLVSFSDGTPPLYVTGDTVWYDGIAEVARRFQPRVVLLFAGSARTRGPFNLTMNTNDAIETAHAFPDATIVPIHCDGWGHFTQSAKDLEDSFKALGIASRLRLLAPGVPTAIAGLSEPRWPGRSGSPASLPVRPRARDRERSCAEFRLSVSSATARTARLSPGFSAGRTCSIWQAEQTSSTCQRAA